MSIQLHGFVQRCLPVGTHWSFAARPIQFTGPLNKRFARDPNQRPSMRKEPDEVDEDEEFRDLRKQVGRTFVRARSAGMCGVFGFPLGQKNVSIDVW